MTKPQIWVAAFLGMFILLFFIQKLTTPTEAMPNMTINSSPVEEQVNQDLTGAELIKQFGCLSCHGQNLEGTKMGPALADLKKHWNRDELINYLRNPNSFMDTERFVEYKKQYTKSIMPGYSNKDVKDLGKIADYLLKK
ncbi:MAG: cytochrome c [Ignavibacteriaceae bacterium]|nr:cytochrome c [Ignavibacteriaceae bacterium]